MKDYGAAKSRSRENSTGFRFVPAEKELLVVGIKWARYLTHCVPSKSDCVVYELRRLIPGGSH
jgi:hypothetical protein